MKSIIYFDVLNYTDENLAFLSESFNLVRYSNPSMLPDESFDEIFGVFAPLGFTYNAKFFGKFQNLKFIASNTTSIPHIDHIYCEHHGIAVIALHDQSEFISSITPTSEHALGLILALQRNTMRSFRSVTEDHLWNRRLFGGGKMLSRQKIGIVGMGRIGQNLTRILHATGASVEYYDPYVDHLPGKLTKLDELVMDVDVLSVHAKVTAQSQRMFTREIFSKMRSTAIFVNTARSELVDESDLLWALENKKIAGAAIDVLEGEFNYNFSDSLDSNPLVKYAQSHDNLIITPHIGGSTIDAWAETELHVIKRAVLMGKIQ